MAVLPESMPVPATRHRIRPIEDAMPGPPARWTHAPEPSPQPPVNVTSLLASLHHHTFAH